MSTTFHTWSVVLVEINSNPACLGKEVDDLMKIDVYNFLHIVNSAGGTNSNTACLGEEVDDLMEMYEIMEVDEMADHQLGEKVDDLMEVKWMK